MGLMRRTGVIVTAVASAAVVTPWLAGPATAAPCPDAEIVFARGTTEAPGVGPTGQAFVDAVRSQVGPKSVGVYAVDYPATMAFSTAVQGISDARAHILSTVASCPDTKLVLGGFSQGAAVMGFVTASVVPEGVSPDDVPAPMPPEVADHVAAVVLFGKPSTRFMNVLKDPDVVVGPYYAAKSVDLCVDNDLVCDPRGRGFAVHNQYTELGLVNQGATFAVQRLQAEWAAEAATAAAAGEEPAPGPDATALVVSDDDQAPVPHLAPVTPVPMGPPPGPAVPSAQA
ncbi:cutinase family protein [Mycolicibacterium arenosum]|uniref:Cutinase family protein n=1 Tax=Mycolicibacterium arenosum TaxID=2952157 RepID=A0ABT1M137_9MYCO|nr:cutinase family protein [Mycolicibacterium sp. CAU 1645]MCP9272147.1 cutinase family protein [Mycolicibacterium sp. CAU 1645]